MGIKEKLKRATAAWSVVLMLAPGVVSAQSSYFDLQSGLNLANGTFQGTGSRIYDNSELHVSTDNFLFLDAPVRVTVSNDLAVRGKYLLFDGGVQGTGSEIYDNSELHIATDNFLFLDAPLKVTVSNALDVGGALVVTGAITGNLTGNVTGNLTGNVTGALTGNASGTASNVTGVVAIANGGTGSATAADARTALGLGSIALQGANAVAITGGTIDGTVIGGTTAAAGTFTTLIATTLQGALTGNVTGNVTGNLTGNVTGNLTGDVTGNVTGNATGLTLSGSSTNVTGNMISDGSLISVKSASLTNTNQGAVRGHTDVAAGFGSSTSSSPKWGVGTYGNVAGADLTGTANLIAGVFGMYSITGTNASTYPVGAVLAGIGDTTTTADGAVVAYIDGDSGVTTAGAAFKVMHNNSTSGSGFSYGLDLYDAARDGYNAVSFLTADIRLASGTTISSGAANPGTCVKGSIFMNTTSGLLNVCEAADTWTAK